VAAAGKLMGFETIGVIRGEELGADLEKTFSQNPTLKFAASQGMKFHFVSRSDYREKENNAFIRSLKKQLGTFISFLKEAQINWLSKVVRKF
jgi:1-aminocyclopropane-1-carboxylate deaminase